MAYGKCHIHEPNRSDIGKHCYFITQMGTIYILSAREENEVVAFIYILVGDSRAALYFIDCTDSIPI